MQKIQCQHEIKKKPFSPYVEDGQNNVDFWGMSEDSFIPNYHTSKDYNKKKLKQTLLKWVACWTFRTGCIMASRTTMLISAPEYLLWEEDDKN